MLAQHPPTMQTKHPGAVRISSIIWAYVGLCCPIMSNESGEKNVKNTEFSVFHLGAATLSASQKQATPLEGHGRQVRGLGGESRGRGCGCCCGCW